MSDDIDLLVSNGTCYWRINEKTPDNIIPCGNAENANYACCIQGDFCLESNVCYNANHTTTYIVGCTDPGYISPACPRKNAFEDQIIVGLTRCGLSEDTSSQDEVWAGCDGNATQTELGVPGVCTCTDIQSQGLFHQGPSIYLVGSLPTTIGGTISFNSSHMPSTVDSGGATRTSERPFTETLSSTGSSSRPSSLTATASNTAAPVVPNSNEELTTGAKAGIAVGSILGAAMIGAIIFLAFVVLRRYRKPENEPQVAVSPHLPPPPMSEYSETPPPKTPKPQGLSPAWDGNWTGFKSELPADIPAQELSGSTSNSSEAGYGSYDPQNSYRASSVSSVSSHGDDHSRASSVSSPYLAPPRMTAAGVPSMDPISELHGEPRGDLNSR